MTKKCFLCKEKYTNGGKCLCKKCCKLSTKELKEAKTALGICIYCWEEKLPNNRTCLKCKNNFKNLYKERYKSTRKAKAKIEKSNKDVSAILHINKSKKMVLDKVCPLCTKKYKGTKFICPECVDKGSEWIRDEKAKLGFCTSCWRKNDTKLRLCSVCTVARDKAEEKRRIKNKVKPRIVREPGEIIECESVRAARLWKLSQDLAYHATRCREPGDFFDLIDDPRRDYL